MSQLNINYYTIGDYECGLMDVREISNGKEVKFSYCLCNPSDFQEFQKNIREKRRTFLILEENGIRTFELLVDEKGNATLRYPEWSNTVKELKLKIGEVHHLVQFPVVEREKLKKIVYQYVKNSFEKIDKEEYPFKFIKPSVLTMLSEEYLNDLINEAEVIQNNYCYIAFYEWLENRFFYAESERK